MRVQVYWNYHKRKWSIVALEGEQKGRVIRHASLVTISEPKFVVQPAGRDRVRREKRKNVHAFVRGNLSSYVPSIIPTHGPKYKTEKVHYNPYKYDSFVLENNREPIHEATTAYLVARPDWGGETVDTSVYAILKKEGVNNEGI